jgi:superfamily II DNA or RNA helicase/HKD family nuclease
MDIQQIITQSIQTGFINQMIQSDKSYRPELLTNDHKQGKKVLSTILQELETCEEFWFSVAFVTTSGIATLMNTLIELEKKNIKGKILASQYLNFTQPEALKRLKQFKNIELRIATEGAFHSKGYLFKNKGVYDLIIGSSNLTQTALCSNKEWNLKISATEESELIDQVEKEFHKEFEAAKIVTDKYLLEYGILWKEKMQFERTIKQKRKAIDKVVITPNLMQREALENINHLRAEGKGKALLVSATGTGKTFLSAFDVQQFKPKKFLFIVHRRTIAEEAMKTFQGLLSDDIKMGIYSGAQRELNADYIFCTVQTISKREHLDKFKRNHFDYIVIDETHRAGADSYKRIMEHFTPKFMLGMTATPERTDGADIFKLFDYNIAYEIRLHRALSENMLCPFHYYGVTDLTIDGEEVDDQTDFNKLFAVERADRVIENAELYGCDDGEVRGLVFCSRNEIALELSKQFNEKGYNTIALTGDNSEDERRSAIESLESEEKKDKLDYIFTVDIFNEGIDIPRVNQIIMLRPTQSAIIFVQQLGRGLRKNGAKDYLTVIDFIGNYNNNYLVPIALYGDKTYNKDTLRKLMTSGSSHIPGSSTINFDEITKERIFDAIDKANMSKLVALKSDYNNLKNKLGRIPMMLDFLEYGARDPWLYVKYKKSYLNFINVVEEQYRKSLNNKELKLLEYFNLEINNTKRVEESIILLELIDHSEISITKLKMSITTKFDYEIDNDTIESCINNLNFNFIRQDYKIVKKEGAILKVDSDLIKALSNPVFKQFLLDNTSYSILGFKNTYSKEKLVGGLIRFKKYGRKDVCRILNWDLDISSTLYGYRTRDNITPCFVTYKKSLEISESTKYNDHFIDSKTFAWESRSQRNIESPEIQNVINSKRILLFVKKGDGEGTDFYFIGDCKIINGSIKQDKMDDGKPVVHFSFELDEEVDEGLLKYLTTDNMR